MKRKCSYVVDLKQGKVACYKGR